MPNEKILLGLFDRIAKYIPLPVIVALFAYAASVFVIAKVNNIEETRQLFYINAIYFCLVIAVTITICYYIFRNQLQKIEHQKRYSENTFYISVFPFEKENSPDINFSTRIFERLKSLNRDKNYNVIIVDETNNSFKKITSIEKAKSFLDYACTNMVIFGRIININNNTDTEVYPECVTRYDLQEFDSRPANDKEKVLDSLEEYIENNKETLEIKKIGDDAVNLNETEKCNRSIEKPKGIIALTLITSLIFIFLSGLALGIFKQKSWKPKSDIYTFKIEGLITKKALANPCLKYKEVGISNDFSEPYYSNNVNSTISIDFTEKDSKAYEFEASADLYQKKIYTYTPAIDFKEKAKKIKLEPNFIDIRKRYFDDEDDAKELLVSILDQFHKDAKIMVYSEGEYMASWKGDSTIEWNLKSRVKYEKFNVKPNVQIERKEDKITKMQIEIKLN